MIPLLAPEQRGLVTQLAWSDVLLAFDYDGTLAPIVPERDGAVMRPLTARLFRLLCSTYPCAVVSGRSRDDVAGRLEGAAVRHIVGNHGLEPDGDLPAFESQMLEARRALQTTLAAQSGVDLEDKRYSLALHYRGASDKRRARAAIERAVERLPLPLRVVHGKLVVNVVPAHAPHKGTAVLSTMARERVANALFVGDDITDEDVFRLEQPQRLVGVRVGASARSSARFYLKSQAHIDALLARFLELRRPEFQL